MHGWTTSTIYNSVEPCALHTRSNMRGEDTCRGHAEVVRTDGQTHKFHITQNKYAWKSAHQNPYLTAYNWTAHTSRVHTQSQKKRWIMHVFIYSWTKWVAGQLVYSSRGLLSDVPLFMQKYSTAAPRWTGISVREGLKGHCVALESKFKCNILIPMVLMR